MLVLGSKIIARPKSAIHAVLKYIAGTYSYICYCFITIIITNVIHSAYFRHTEINVKVLIVPFNMSSYFVKCGSMCTTNASNATSIREEPVFSVDIF